MAVGLHDAKHGETMGIVVTNKDGGGHVMKNMEKPQEF